jgi:hypothetical protein
MTKVLIDTVMFDKLHRLAEPLELCDSAGKVLARVLPSQDAQDFEPAGPQVSDDELLRRSKTAAKGRSTEDVLKRLGQQ